jgi:hypothetical protein
MQYECTMYSGRAPAKKEKPCYTVTHLAENHGERGPYKEPKKQNKMCWRQWRILARLKSVFQIHPI